MKDDKQNILLVREGTSFLYNALKNRLQENGYRITEMSPEVEELEKYGDTSEICLVYLGEYAEQAGKPNSFFWHLKEFRAQGNNTVWLIGTKEEVSIVKNQLSWTVGWKTYERPVDLNRFSADLEQFFEKKEAGEQEKTILMVDDDVVFLKMMSEWLADSYKTVTVTSGMQAITYLATNKPDLILLDYEGDDRTAGHGDDTEQSGK